MSDTSQGEGWWAASDGKWYPPEQHPDLQQPTQAVDETGPPTQATPPPTAGSAPAAPPPVPPTQGGPAVPPPPPTQAMPPVVPVGPPGGPPGGPGGVPRAGSPGGPGSNRTKWIIGGAVALAIVAIAAFLLLRGGNDKNTTAIASEKSSQSSDQKSDQNSDQTDSSSKSSSKSSSSSGAETVDPNNVEDRLLAASDIGSDFTDGTFTPSTQTTDPCGQPNARSVVPPTKDVGSTASDQAQNLFFEQEVEFYKSSADVKKAFDVATASVTNCTQGTFSDSGTTAPFSVSGTKDVSSQLGVTKAVEFTVTTGGTTVIEVGVRLDNCITTFEFQFPTSSGQSGVPDEIGISKQGVDKLLG